MEEMLIEGGSKLVGKRGQFSTGIFNLDEMRLGLLYNDKIAVKSKKNAQFVIEEMGKKTAEIFSKLQLGKFIPN